MVEGNASGEQLVMAELKAPSGAFLLLELEPGVSPEQVRALFHITVRLAGVQSCSDLSMVPVELLNERVLMRLSPAEQRAWKRATK